MARITSISKDPGQDFARVLAEPLAQLASTRHVMLVFNNNKTVKPEFELEQISAESQGGGHRSAENRVSQLNLSLPVSSPVMQKKHMQFGLFFSRFFSHICWRLFHFPRAWITDPSGCQWFSCIGYGAALLGWYRLRLGAGIVPLCLRAQCSV